MRNYFDYVLGSLKAQNKNKHKLNKIIQFNDILLNKWTRKLIEPTTVRTQIGGNSLNTIVSNTLDPILDLIKDNTDNLSNASKLQESYKALLEYIDLLHATTSDIETDRVSSQIHEMNNLIELFNNNI